MDTLAIREICFEELAKGNQIRTIVKGRSMFPFINRGDTVIVKPIKFEEARIGDIIVYTRSLEQDFTAHRLIRRRRDNEGREYLFTKGDANINGDDPVYCTEFYGKLVTIEKRHGRTINLETRFNRLFAYLIVPFSWISAVVREAIFHPSSFLRRVERRWLKK